MSFESYYWRKSLKRDLSFIEKKLGISVSNFESEKIDEFYSLVEIKLFTIAYSVRKLLDARKFPDVINKKEIIVTAYPRNKNEKFRIFIGDSEKLYEFNLGKKTKLRLRYICNQFVHSFIFQIYRNYHNKLRYLYFTSDASKDKYLYSVELKNFIKAIRSIVDIYPTESHTTYDKYSDTYKTVVK